MNFYFLPSRRCLVLWSQKCACTALSRWIKHCFDEAEDCPKGTSARTYIADKGFNFSDLQNLKAFLSGDKPTAKTMIVSYRDPASRITSSFVNKFHVYENRTIFDGGKKMQGFSRQFAKDLKQELQSAKHLKRKMGDFSLRDMIIYLHQKRSELHTINDHFTPPIDQQDHLDIIKAACQDKATSIFPLRVEKLSQDLKKINRHIHQKFVPRHLNNTELPGPEWSLSESADLVASPISSLFENKIIPKAGALRNYLEQDADFKKQYMDLFQHDYSLLNLMESLRPEST